METARLIVDLDALATNYRVFCPSGRPAAAVVKADAYGLGIAPVVRTLLAEGCRDFFVATLDEGLAVREATADGRIYVLAGALDDDDAEAMANAALRPVLNDAAQVARWRRHGRLPAAVHVDTGMNRLGFPADAVTPQTFADVDVCLLLSHLANADDPMHPMNAKQRGCFDDLKRLLPSARTSFGNSAGALSGTASDLPRPGIALYGGNPFAALPNPMRPVATLEARVIALRDAVDGEPVGYGGTYKTFGDTRIGVLGIGYADGVPRLASNRAEVASDGTYLPVIGRISMDLTQIDATAADGLAVGDWVEVFGPTISIDDFAAWADTISYEVLTGIGNRVRRCYVGR
jgi:alanine racemase